MIRQPAHLSTTDWLDLGCDHSLQFLIWAPDFESASNAAKWAHLAQMIREQPIVGAAVRHQCATETGIHEGGIYFRTELTVAAAFDDRTIWDVEAWEPLTLSPSLLSHCPCSDHGYIRGGKWVRA